MINRREDHIYFKPRGRGLERPPQRLIFLQAIAATNRKTLLIDLDPQGNASSASGVKKEKIAFLTTTLGKNISELIQTSSNQYDTF